MTYFRRPAAGLMSIAVVALFAMPAAASTGDRDNDGMPNTWETNNDLSPDSPNAGGDPDRDGLSNLEEYRVRTKPRTEDTDGDGAEDGFEVRVKIKPLDRDTNDDGDLDGDEDKDRDGTDNEDEDDIAEPCGSDDEDRDSDNLDNEDENDFRLRAGDADSDDDDILDGDEDRNEDGQSNEDEDDDSDAEDDDECDGDSDNDGRDDEDEEDTLGLVGTYNAETGVLTITTINGVELTLNVSPDVEIDMDDDCVTEENQGDDSGSGSEEPSLSDLAPGTPIGEFEIDYEDGLIEEIEIDC